jgi:hypothetical protein
MNTVEGQWKPFQQEGVQIHQCKKWLLAAGGINRFADENISIKR